MRFSVRTWYAAKSKDTAATLTIKGRMIFRVVRIMTPQFAETKIGREGWVRAAKHERSVTGPFQWPVCLVSTNSFQKLASR